MSSELRLKKLRGSGGYIMATVTDEQQMKGNLGGPDLFLAPIGRLDASTITSIALKSISSPVQQTMDTIEHDGEGDDYSAVIYAISCIKNQLTCVLHRGPDNSDMYDTINPIIEKIGSVFDKTVICTKKEGHSALENFEKVKKATEFMSRYVLPK